MRVSSEEQSYSEIKSLAKSEITGDIGIICVEVKGNELKAWIYARGFKLEQNKIYKLLGIMSFVIEGLSQS